MRKIIKIIPITILVLITISIIIQSKSNHVSIYKQYTDEYIKIITNITNETKGLSIEEAIQVIRNEKNKNAINDLKKIVEKCESEFSNSSKNITFYHNSIKKQYDELNMLFIDNTDMKKLQDILTSFRIDKFYKENVK
ncbi:hypothetical protein [Vallitalea guaymasensis]|uniref:hypothetical protein n=1 Tax=Vallitalea guaymasensis TaxID=1185412 RepID=UPI002357EB3F|nr:hypothetical protein [Vallitalea guaymasensis]